MTDSMSVIMVGKGENCVKGFFAADRKRARNVVMALAPGILAGQGR